MRKHASLTKKILISAGVLAFAVAVIAFFKENNLVIFGVLAVIVGLVFVRPSFEKRDLAALFVGGFVGPCMEIILIRAGVWSYAHPTAAGIPVWLPLLWALSAFFFSRVTVWAKR